MNELAARFHRYFDVWTADNDRVRDAAFQLRYRVYCLETGFEDKNAFCDGRERDTYDDVAAQAIIKHRASGAGVASLRLVMPGAGSRCGFPLEQRAPGLLAGAGIDERVLPRATTGEISRFAISKTVRRRAGDNPASGAVAPKWPETVPIARVLNSRRLPLVTFGLFLALIRISETRGATHWLAIMEPPLLRLLSRFGIVFTPIGGLIDYHGRRQPCFASVAEVLRGVYDTQTDLWRLITDQGTSGFCGVSRPAIRTATPVTATDDARGCKPPRTDSMAKPFAR